MLTYKSVIFNYIETDKRTKVNLNNYELELAKTK